MYLYQIVLLILYIIWTVFAIRDRIRYNKSTFNDKYFNDQEDDIFAIWFMLHICIIIIGIIYLLVFEVPWNLKII